MFTCGSMPEADTSQFRKLLSFEFAPFGHLTNLQLDQLEAHYNLLQRWNQRMNLTRILTLDDVVRLHYCESLFLGTMLPTGNLSIADVGSGAGFPGIPLAILRPTSHLTLIESHHRKAVFLHEASRTLQNVRVASSRAEDIDERYDWMVSRAVSRTATTHLQVGSNTALLLTAEEATLLGGNWKVVNSPWGQQRVVALCCSTWNVPRGT